MGNLRKKFQTPQAPYVSSDTKNLAGGKAWTKPNKEYFKQLMNTGGIRNTYYMDEKTVIKESMQSIKDYVKESPMDAAKLSQGGRNAGFMRTLPIMALTELSKQDSRMFSEAFIGIIKTPRDLIDFVDIVKASRGLGRKIKKAMNKYINTNLNQFYAMKYGDQLRIASRLSHPKPKDKNLMKYIFGNEISLEEYPQLKALEAFKKGEIDPIEAITKHRLEMQTVIGIKKPTAEMWEALAPQMSTFQLIKNLATLERHLDGKKLEAIIKKQLTIERLKKGRVLPFRILQAYNKINDPFAKNALGTLANEYPKHYDWSKLGRVCIAPDISGSMTWSYGNNNKLSAAIIAGMLSGVLKVGIGDDAFLLPWGSQAYPNYCKSNDVVGIAGEVARAQGGGTFMEAPVQHLLKHNIGVDTFILVTDSEEWGSGWLNDWIFYKKKFPKARAYLLRVDMYNSNPFSPETAERYDIHQIYGWNDNVFKILLNQ